MLTDIIWSILQAILYQVCCGGLLIVPLQEDGNESKWRWFRSWEASFTDMTTSVPSDISIKVDLSAWITTEWYSYLNYCSHRQGYWFWGREQEEEFYLQENGFCIFLFFCLDDIVHQYQPLRYWAIALRPEVDLVDLNKISTDLSILVKSQTITMFSLQFCR